MADLSVIIPGKNEEFMQRTIDSVLYAARGDTEVIAVLDGYWPEFGIIDNPKVQIIHNTESVGQRKATNQGIKLSQSKYIMKLDAHCSLEDGFDVKLMENCEYGWTVIPTMYVLDAFHWVCKKCEKWYHQGPKKEICDKCNGTEFHRKIIWEPKTHKKTNYMWFDNDLVIHYFDSVGLKKCGNIEEAKKRYSHKLREWAQEDITDIMVGIGACWFLHRERYWDMGGLDENHGSWGQMAIEIACKTWLSGGRHVVNKTTWFAHLPRTQPGFCWPYHNPSSAQELARQYSRDMWLNNKWSKQKHKLEWLIKKFSPVPTWEPSNIAVSSDKKVSKGIVYYTDNQCEERIAGIVRKQLKKIANGHEIISVSHYPTTFGKNYVVDEPRSILTMFKQIYVGLENCNAEIVYLCEHDVVYHPSHFGFVPPKKDVFYYNENCWKVDAKSGQALFYHTKQTSGLCAYRELLLEHYARRVERVQEEGFSRRMGFEPGTHKFPRGIDNHKAESYWSEYPNLDIRHTHNLTANRFKKEQFRSKNSIKGWKTADKVPFWGETKGRFDELLKEIAIGAHYE